MAVEYYRWNWDELRIEDDNMQLKSDDSMDFYLLIEVEHQLDNRQLRKNVSSSIDLP